MYSKRKLRVNAGLMVSFLVMNLKKILGLIISFLFLLWQWMLEQGSPDYSMRQRWIPAYLSSTQLKPLLLQKEGERLFWQPLIMSFTGKFFKKKKGGSFVYCSVPAADCAECFCTLDRIDLLNQILVEDPTY